jgi:hypothetical protein
MRSTVIAFFLSVFAVAAAAAPHNAAPAAVSIATPTATAADRAAKPAKPATARTANGRPTPDLITAAGAVTHDGPPSAQPSPAPAKGTSEDRPRRTGSAMLLAALALMSGIALRRYSARLQ